MRLRVLAFLFLFTASAAFGQTVDKTPSAFKPYIFEPYSADYKYRGTVLGYEFDIFTFSTRIFELDDHWEELQTLRFKFPDEPETTIFATSKVDLATGLLRSMKVTDGGNNVSELNFGDGKIEVAATDGKRTRTASVDNAEKVYPCFYSSVFLSYLPLADGYQNSFTCVMPDEDDAQAFLIQRLTLKVVGREKISTKAGLFDCFKLTSDVEDLRRIKNGKIKEFTKPKKRDANADRFWRNVYSYTWIDVRSRKVIKGEFNFKGLGGISTEMERVVVE